MTRALEVSDVGSNMLVYFGSKVVDDLLVICKDTRFCELDIIELLRFDFKLLHHELHNQI